MQIQTHAIYAEASSLSLTNLVQIYAQRIEDRKRSLSGDVAFYQAKLDELDLLDPQDCTGLRRIYTSHLDRTSALLRSVSI